MKDYFKRLKEHPGLGTALFITIIGALAGGTNKSFDPLVGMLFGFIITGLVVWSIVLISNFKSK